MSLRRWVQLEASESRCQQLVRAVREKEDQLLATEAARRGVEEELSRTREALREAEDLCSERLGSEREKEGELRDLRERYGHAESVVRGLQTDLASVRKEKTDAELSLEQLQLKYNRLMQECMDGSAEVVRLEAEVERARGEMNRFQRQEGVRASELEEAERRVAGLKQTVSDLQSEIAQRVAEAQALGQINMELRSASTTSATVVIEQLTQDIRELRDRCRGLEEDRTRLEGERRALEMQRSAMVSAGQADNKRLASAGEQLAAQQADLARSADQILELQRRLKDGEGEIDR